MLKLELGDWVKLRNEKDYYNVKSIDLDSGYIKLEDITGSIWHVATSSIEKKCTNNDVFGKIETTTADEYNLPICSNDLNVKNKEKKNE